MAEPADRIVPMLREMRAEFVAFHEETMERFDGVDRRLDAIEAEQACLWQALAARILLRKDFADSFGHRIDRLEQRVGLLGYRP